MEKSQAYHGTRADGLLCSVYSITTNIVLKHVQSERQL